MTVMPEGRKKRKKEGKKKHRSNIVYSAHHTLSPHPPPSPFYFDHDSDTGHDDDISQPTGLDWTGAGMTRACGTYRPGGSATSFIPRPNGLPMAEDGWISIPHCKVRCSTHNCCAGRPRARRVVVGSTAKHPPRWGMPSSSPV